MTTACNSKLSEEQINRILKRHIYFSKAHRFLKAGEENRSLAALEAYKKKIAWPFSFSLEAVVSYEKQKRQLDQELLDAIKDKDTVDTPRLRELIKNQTLQTDLYQYS